MEVNEEDGCLHAQIETCHWFNLIVAFVFNELRDSVVVKRLNMKINADLMMSCSDIDL